MQNQYDGVSKTLGTGHWNGSDKHCNSVKFSRYIFSRFFIKVGVLLIKRAEKNVNVNLLLIFADRYSLFKDGMLIYIYFPALRLSLYWEMGNMDFSIKIFANETFRHNFIKNEVFLNGYKILLM